MRKITINKMQVGDKVRWIKRENALMTIKKFSPCSEEWCKLAENFHYYKECERVRILGTIGTSNYVLCCKDIEVVKHESD